MAAAVSAASASAAAAAAAAGGGGANPVVFFDVQISGKDVGRVKLELFADTCPKTAENFRWVGGCYIIGALVVCIVESAPLL